MEEYVLGARFAREELNIIDDQYIDLLVEMYEICPRIFLDLVNILLGEFFSGDIQYNFIRILVLDLNTDGMGQVCFA